VALAFTLDAPQRVDRLVLVSSYGLQAQAPGQRLGYLFLKLPGLNAALWALMPRSRGLVRSSLKALMPTPGAVTEPLVDQVMAELAGPRPGAAWRAFQNSEVLWSGTRTCLMPRLGEIQAPVLLLFGERDSLVPLACAREAHARLPNARLHVLPGCGHWPQREQPEVVGRLVDDFLAEGEAEPASSI
jgi:pimeloyl-ACP methyl ester carboxylesterase